MHFLEHQTSVTKLLSAILQLNYSSSNWNNYRGNDLHTGSSTNNGPVRSYVQFVFNLINYGINSSPAVDRQGNIYFGSQSIYLYKLSCSGKFIWRFAGVVNSVSSPALSYNEDVLYYGDDGINVYALSTLSGSLIWKYVVRGAINASPYVYGRGYNAIVFVGSTGNYIYGFNATNGYLLTIGNVGSSIDYSSPVVYNNTIYFGTLNNFVNALSIQYPTLKSKWVFPTMDEIWYCFQFYFVCLLG